ncbi:MAG: sugar transferase [Taibaiella sp.]|jgi:lipopolysaccharide/colanic/teichoic acid biosynthesis glycosyltransferase
MEVQEFIRQDIEIIKSKFDRPILVNNTGLRMKRAFDIVFSLLVMLLVFSWLFPIIALLITIDSKGGLFFVQQRNGLNNKIFRCLKFRTMVVNKDADFIAARENDHRITRIGNFLRVSGLDELPQLINVLAGDMSIVGPRPHMVNDNLRFEKIAENYNNRSLVKPGITGLAQVNGYKGNTTDDQSIKIRTILDLKYVSKRDFSLDLQIIAATIKLMFVEVGKIGKSK